MENFHLGTGTTVIGRPTIPDGAVGWNRLTTKNGLLEGRFEQFHPDGQLQMEARYGNGGPKAP